MILNWYFRILCILAVDLVITLINVKIVSLATTHHRIIVTIMGMIAVLILVSFLFSIIDKFTKFILKITVEMGNLIGFRKTIIFAMITAMLVGLFSCYHYVWFGSWPHYQSFPYKDFINLIPL